MAGVVPIRLEKYVSTKDGSGDFKETVTKYNLWAEILSYSASRGTTNGKTSVTETIPFRVRFRPDMKVDANWRVVYDGKRYTVSSIEKENGKRFYWILTASGD